MLLKEILIKVSENSDIKSKFENSNSVQEVYEICVSLGYNENIEKFLEDFKTIILENLKLSQSNLDSIAGGVSMPKLLKSSIATGLAAISMAPMTFAKNININSSSISSSSINYSNELINKLKQPKVLIPIASGTTALAIAETLALSVIGGVEGYKLSKDLHNKNALKKLIDEYSFISSSFNDKSLSKENRDKTNDKCRKYAKHFSETFSKLYGIDCKDIEKKVEDINVIEEGYIKKGLKLDREFMAKSSFRKYIRGYFDEVSSSMTFKFKTNKMNIQEFMEFLFDFNDKLNPEND